MKIEDLKFDERNYRVHDDRNKSLIKKSIDECGLARSVVVDSENCLIGGNGVVSQVDKDTPIRVIETDGSELVVVKRTDLKTDDEKRKRLAVLDNSTTDSSNFDYALLHEDFSEDELDELGVIVPVEDPEKEIITKYTRKISVPIYEIKGETPKIEEMISTEKADKLVEEIKKADIDDETKRFLVDCTTRLYEFRYDKIAEFYAHQDEKVKDLMEKLALVIIDFNKAVENGYIKLNEFIENVFLSERDE